MRGSFSTGRDLALVAVFAALIAALSLTPGIPLGAGVPLTLQTLGVGLAGLVLGPWRGFLAVLLYVVVGLAGLPVFAGGASGLGTLAGPTVGYLVSFPVMALVAGLIARWTVRRGQSWAVGKLIVAALVASLLINHPAGIAGLVANAHLSWGVAVVTDLAFVPGDVVKGVLAGLVAAVVHRAFPALLAAGCGHGDGSRGSSRMTQGEKQTMPGEPSPQQGETPE